MSSKISKFQIKGQIPVGFILFQKNGLNCYSDIFKMAAGTMPTTFSVPNTAGWDLDQLLPSESVVTGWKWDYGVTPLSDITVSIKTRCLPPPPLPRFFLPFFPNAISVACECCHIVTADY